MREFVKSLFSYSLAQSFFGVAQMFNLVTPARRAEDKGPATKAFDELTHATTDQMDSTLRSMFTVSDNLQRGLVNLTFAFLFPWTLLSRRVQDDVEKPRGSRQDAPRQRSWPSEPRRWSEIYEPPSRTM